MVQAIADRAAEADLMIVGSSEEGWLRRRVFGSHAWWTVRKADCPAILANPATHPVKFGFQTFFQFFRQLEVTPEEKERVRAHQNAGEAPGGDPAGEDAPAGEED